MAEPESNGLTADEQPIRQRDVDQGVEKKKVAAFKHVVPLQTAFSLPQSVDDAEQKFGLDLYDRMDHHPVVQGCVNGIASVICESETKILPAFQRPESEADSQAEADYRCSMEAVDFISHCVDLMAVEGLSLQELKFQMVRAGLVEGSKLAEVVLRLEDEGQYAGRLVLESIMPKPRQNYVWVTDQSYKVFGVQAKIPGQGIALRSGPIVDISQLPNTVDRRKLLWYTPMPVDGDPRGKSVLRGAYIPWRKLELGDPEDVKTAAAFGGGMLSLEGGVDAPEYVIDESNNEVPVAQAAQAAMQAMRNSAWIVPPPGWSLKRHNPATTDYFDGYTRRATEQIVMAIATASRAFLEARFGSRADSDTAFDLVSCFVSHHRLVWDSAFEHRVVRQLMLVNFGPEFTKRYCPKVSSQTGNSVDLPARARAARDLVEGGVVTAEMRPNLVHGWFGEEWIEGKTVQHIQQEAKATAKPVNGKKDKKDAERT